MPWLLPGLALAVGVAVGTFLYREKSPDPAGEEEHDSAARKNIPADVAQTEARLPAASTDDVHQVLGSATKEDLLAALRLQIAGSASADDIFATLEFVARTRPALALELISAAARNAEEKYHWTSAVLGRWAQTDAAAAWAWTLQPAHREIPGEPALHIVVLNQAAASDPAQIANLVGTSMLNTQVLTALGLRPDELAHSGVQALLGSGHGDAARQAVEQWARDGANSAIGNAAIEEVALHLAQTSSQGAADWLRTLPASEGRNFAIATLAASWVETAPQAAIEWAAKLDANDGRNEALQRAFNRWAEKELVTAAQWLAENESRPAADRLIANLVTDSPLVSSNPRVALQWAALIDDAVLRTQNIEQVLIDWGGHNPTAATSYIAESTLISAEQKTRLLARVRQLTE